MRISERLFLSFEMLGLPGCGRFSIVLYSCYRLISLLTVACVVFKCFAIFHIEMFCSLIAMILHFVIIINSFSGHFDCFITEML